MSDARLKAEIARVHRTNFGVYACIRWWRAILSARCCDARVRYPLALNNWYSIEHHTSTPIAEWDFRTLRVNTDEESILTDHGIEFLVPRQTRWPFISTGH